MFSVPEQYRRGPAPSAVAWYSLCVSSRLFQTNTYDFLGSYSVWIPAVPVVVRSGDDCYTDFEPLFPGYIFVGTAAGQTPGGIERAARGYNPSFLLLQDMDGKFHGMTTAELSAMVAAATPVAPPLQSFAVGTRVRVVSGPLRGITGTVVSSRGGVLRIRGRAYSKDVELAIHRDPEVFVEAYAEN